MMTEMNQTGSYPEGLESHRRDLSSQTTRQTRWGEPGGSEDLTWGVKEAAWRGWPVSGESVMGRPGR